MATPAAQLDELFDSDFAAGSGAQRQESVLLIEDSEDAILLVQSALQKYGRGRYRLECASNLSDGLRHLAQPGIDVVVLDLGLPDSTGPTSCAWVREMAPLVPVIILTGDTSEETELSVLASGASDYLDKTQVSGLVLVEAIQAALSRYKSKEDAPPYYQSYPNEEFVRRFRWRLT